VQAWQRCDVQYSSCIGGGGVTYGVGNGRCGQHPIRHQASVRPTALQASGTGTGTGTAKRHCEGHAPSTRPACAVRSSPGCAVERGGGGQARTTARHGTTTTPRPSPTRGRLRARQDHTHTHTPAARAAHGCPCGCTSCHESSYPQR
jgi:hypothetical protein